MRSETTADISDSIAPSIATVIAGEISGSQQVHTKMRDPEDWESRVNTTESGVDRSDRKFEEDNYRRPQEQSGDVTGDSLHEDHEENNHCEPQTAREVSTRENDERLCARLKMRRREVTWNLIDLETKEIFDLSASDDNGNTVRETHDYGARDELGRRAQTGRFQYQ
jgi:hypothetical protein